VWPVEAVADVWLPIFGGEACPAELVERPADPRRELWNTYGRTDTTVVACGIGLPLHGRQLAAVDAHGNPVPHHEVLVIGGVAAGRCLDAAEDAQEFRPAPACSSNCAIPADVDLTGLTSATIWCDRLSVSFTAAALQPVSPRAVVILAR
jgi:non-ribosomal peptide synthetase component F